MGERRSSMKTALLVLLLSSAIAFGEDQPQGLADRYNILVSGSRKSDPYNAYHGLVAAGEKGWNCIFQAHFNLDSSGDLTRQVGAFWECSGIPDDVVARFSAAMDAEVRKRSVNETWALLYAAKDLLAQSQSARRGKHEPEKKALEGLFASLSKDAEAPANALPRVAPRPLGITSRFSRAPLSMDRRGEAAEEGNPSPPQVVEDACLRFRLGRVIRAFSARS